MTVHTDTTATGRIEAAFEKFHAANPGVYVELRRLARQMIREGHRFGIATIYEVARWEATLALRPGGSTLKLNNSYRAYYARMLMDREPDLAGIFKLRELGVASHRIP